MTTIRIITILTLLAFSSKSHSQDISTERIKKDITYLASDKLKGRGTGSKGEKLAAKYIAKQFEAAGLAPKGTDGYYYPFNFRCNTDPKDSTSAMQDRHGKDVVGYLDNGADYTIIIGAHYDHLGLGYDHNSLDPNPKGKIHNGADDNASGTAGVMELARYYAGNNVKEKYNILFICFSGEELGLYGSKKFCESPTIDLSKVDYMINMDMIGRLNDSTKMLMIYGVGTAPDWVPMIDQFHTVFKIKEDSAGVGPSDQTSFYLKNIPVLHFFTGQHADYHKPSDDVDKINFDGEKMVLEFIINIETSTEKLDKLQFLKTKNPDMGSHSYKVKMGVMPDYTFEGPGLRVDGVTDGKPAAAAGVKQGDIILKLGDHDISNMSDYMNALGTFKVGDTTTLKVKRGDQELDLKVTF
ncbi:MAG TPA: M20/M25/M40 family metallo-hydrolase [Bacteroidia bacterium]|jgi:Zn-dependent M28 family amino/carboxypeptidase|nr:M20/M25/M40 family metallo-hydrolase [Bacteroidia bacterium]